MLYALVKQEGVFNTRVRLVGEAPKTDNLDDEVARRNNGNRDYVRNYSTDDDVVTSTQPWLVRQWLAFILLPRATLL